MSRFIPLPEGTDTPMSMIYAAYLGDRFQGTHIGTASPDGSFLTGHRAAAPFGPSWFMDEGEGWNDQLWLLTVRFIEGVPADDITAAIMAGAPPYVITPGYIYAAIEGSYSFFQIDAAWASALTAGDGSTAALLGQGIYAACRDAAMAGGGVGGTSYFPAGWLAGSEGVGAYLSANPPAIETLAMPDPSAPWSDSFTGTVSGLLLEKAVAARAADPAQAAERVELAMQTQRRLEEPEHTFWTEVPGQISARLRGDKPWVDVNKTLDTIFGPTLPGEPSWTDDAKTWVKWGGVAFLLYLAVRLVSGVRALSGR